MKNRRRKILALALCAMLFFMGVGYAILTQTIKVVGINRISGQWNIYIESITPTSQGGSAESKSVSLGEDKKSANFVVNLYDQDDFVEYTVVVRNAGNIPAKLQSVNTSISNPSNFITFTHTATLEEIVGVNATQTFTVLVAVRSFGTQELTDSIGTVYHMDLNYIQNS